VIAVLLNSTNRIAEFTKGDIQSAATKIGQQVHILTANDDGGLNDAFRTASNQRFGALLIGNDVFFNSRADYMAKLAAQYAVPSLYSRREFAAAGGLISYGPSLAAANHQVGVYTGLVLKGEKPANLPVILPTKFELVLNSKAAKTLGIALPPTLLAIADEVIE
jgi:putative ABC transport system substrate-binding protein